MKLCNALGRSALGTVMAIAAITGAAGTVAMAPAFAQTSQISENDVALSVGRGRLITLPSGMSDVFVANDKVADVQIRSARQLYVFGKGPGETSIYATDAAGRVVYSANVRVGNNIETIDQMLSLAMPNAAINVMPMNGFVLLTGTVGAPEDAAEADRLVQAFVGETTKVISRLQTATPLQVNLQVRIAEVNRTLFKEVSGNILTRDSGGTGILGGVFRGRGVGAITDQEFPTSVFPDISPAPIRYDPNTGQPILGRPPAQYGLTRPTGVNALYAAGRLFGLDILAALDLGERSGLVTTLSQPNLTALSGETADFLAGGEFPIPVADDDGIGIEYRKFGVSLAYTPTVLSNGRISMRVRPEVSELSTEGAIRINGFEVPALTVRRAETTVELGSGESFVIAGLLSNRSLGSIDKVPGLGDVPILGTLFKSDTYRRGETELVIVVTPFLVKPVTANRIVLPTDGFQSSNDFQRVILNQTSDGISGGDRPKPTVAPAPIPMPMVTGQAAPAAVPQRRTANKKAEAASGPGFSF